MWLNKIESLLCLIVQSDELMVENFNIKIKKHIGLVQFICTKQQSIIMMANLFPFKMMMMMMMMISLDSASHLKSIS
jgi:hypothetical protein